uniref:Uncharacterized protein n=1 Tax=Arundo donax TaxID=35708 RepID=A0A0A9C8U8_ARUDO
MLHVPCVGFLASIPHESFALDTPRKVFTTIPYCFRLHALATSSSSASVRLGLPSLRIPWS